MTTDKEDVCQVSTPQNNANSLGEPHQEALRTARIRELNDQLRVAGKGGMWLATCGIAALAPQQVHAILAAVKSFTDFTPDNDPHLEHDCAVLTVGDTQVLWKIDYYDRQRQFLSPDPTDPQVTLRVLTVMLASEY